MLLKEFGMGDAADHVHDRSGQQGRDDVVDRLTAIKNKPRVAGPLTGREGPGPGHHPIMLDDPGLAVSRPTVHEFVG
ncbi:hypothetical protein [Streptomyces hydrogenans]|uniref:hypothetical protein n=1 Tax=Streptomyces hydrogenans TaxID=1873719 RepID=UPI00342934C5